MEQRQGTQNNQRVELTSKSLGILESRKTDLVGYVLNPQEVTQNVVIMLIKCGLRREDIHSVRVSKEKDGLAIQARVDEYAVKDTMARKPNSWIGAGNQNGKLKIKQEIYNGLRNKAFIGNLHWQREKIKGDNYIVLNFDPEVLFAFMFDINYDNEFLKVAPIEYQASKKDRKKFGYTPCSVIITFKQGEGNFHVSQVIEMEGLDENRRDRDDD